MCLSKVFLKSIESENLVIDEVSRISENKGTVSMRTLFGEDKEMKGYRIGEVNLVENYVILTELGDNINAERQKKS